jgi:hypothetical protein
VNLRRVRQRYPTLAFLVVDPEVGPLLKAACRRWRPISADEFKRRLKATEWWQKASTDG